MSSWEIRIFRVVLVVSKSSKKTSFKNAPTKKRKKILVLFNHNTFFRKSMVFFTHLYAVFNKKEFFFKHENLHFFNQPTIHILCSGKETTFLLRIMLEYFAQKKLTGQLYRAFLVKNVVYYVLCRFAGAPSFNLTVE